MTAATMGANVALDSKKPNPERDVDSQTNSTTFKGKMKEVVKEQLQPGKLAERGIDQIPFATALSKAAKAMQILSKEKTAWDKQKSDIASSMDGILDALDAEITAAEANFEDLLASSSTKMTGSKLFFLRREVNLLTNIAKYRSKRDAFRGQLTSWLAGRKDDKQDLLFSDQLERNGEPSTSDSSDEKQG